MKELLVLALCLTVVGITPVVAQEVAEPEEETGNPFQKDEVDKRIDKAIDFLVSKQRSDGSITDRGNATTMTSLALMAMASVGNQPVNPDDKGRVMRRGLDFILKESNQDAHGYFGNRDACTAMAS